MFIRLLVRIPNCSLDCDSFLTPCSRAVLEKLVFSQPVKTSVALYGTAKSIPLFTRARDWALCWTRHSVPVRPILLLLPYHFFVGLAFGLISTVTLNKLVYACVLQARLIISHHVRNARTLFLFAARWGRETVNCVWLECECRTYMTLTRAQAGYVVAANNRALWRSSES